MFAKKVCGVTWATSSRFGALNHICLEDELHTGPCICCTCDEQTEQGKVQLVKAIEPEEPVTFSTVGKTALDNLMERFRNESLGTN